MAKPKRFPFVFFVRLNEQTRDLLMKRSKLTGIPPAVVLRAIIEKSLEEQTKS